MTRARRRRGGWWVCASGTEFLRALDSSRKSCSPECELQRVEALIRALMQRRTELLRKAASGEATP